MIFVKKRCLQKWSEMARKLTKSLFWHHDQKFPWKGARGSRFNLADLSRTICSCLCSGSVGVMERKRRGHELRMKRKQNWEICKPVIRLLNCWSIFLIKERWQNLLKECRASITLGDYGEHLISFTLSSPGKEFSPAAQYLPLYNI